MTDPAYRLIEEAKEVGHHLGQGLASSDDIESLSTSIKEHFNTYVSVPRYAIVGILNLINNDDDFQMSGDNWRKLLPLTNVLYNSLNGISPDGNDRQG